MDGPQHYAIGELRLEQAEHTGDHVFAYRLASEASAHFQAAIAATLLGGDRELLSLRPTPPPAEPLRLPL